MHLPLCLCLPPRAVRGRSGGRRDTATVGCAPGFCDRTSFRTAHYCCFLRYTYVVPFCLITTAPDFQARYHNPRTVAAAVEYAALAKRVGLSPATLAIAWSASR